MKTKLFFKILMIVSFALNGFFIVTLVAAVRSKPGTRTLSFPAPREGSFAAAAVTLIPESSPMVFNPVEITLKPGQKTFVQYSVFRAGNQSNLLVNPLYDPGIVAITQTGFGLEITALKEGETLIQSIASQGIIDIAFIVITE